MSNQITIKGIFFQIIRRLLFRPYCRSSVHLGYFRMNFWISLISSEPQLDNVDTASPETPYLHKCISLFWSCYWFFAAEMNCSCFASFLKLWSGFPCATILVEERFKPLRLVQHFYTYHLLQWLNMRGSLESSIFTCWDKLYSFLLASDLKLHFGFGTY